MTVLLLLALMTPPIDANLPPAPPLPAPGPVVPPVEPAPKPAPAPSPPPAWHRAVTPWGTVWMWGRRVGDTIYPAGPVVAPPVVPQPRAFFLPRWTVPAGSCVGGACR
jgi:hypothetical protein